MGMCNCRGNIKLNDEFETNDGYKKREVLEI